MAELNCVTVLEQSMVFGRRFADRGRGGIILMASLGWQGVPGAAHYAATKAYVHTLAEGLHLEFAPFHVDGGIGPGACEQRVRPRRQANGKGGDARRSREGFSAGAGKKATVTFLSATWCSVRRRA